MIKQFFVSLNLKGEVVLNKFPKFMPIHLILQKSRMIVIYRSILKVNAACFEVMSRNCSSHKSALFIPNRIRYQITPCVEPYLNIEKDLKPTVNDMQKSLVKRSNDNCSYDLHDIINSAERLSSIESDEDHLHKRLEEKNSRISIEKDLNVIEDLKKEVKAIRDSMKVLRAERWKIEETTLLQYVRLPNLIDKNTPIDSADEVVYDIGKKPEIINQRYIRSHQALFHREIEFSENSPTSYYLFGDAAKLELSLSWAIQDFLLNAGFQMCSGPDFTRSAIVEGCNPDINLFQEQVESEKVFSLAPTSDFGDISTHAATHLVGSASFESLVSHYIKNIILNPSTSLPQKYFCCGRKYLPIQKSSDITDSLFNVQQSSAVEIIAIAKTASSLNDQLNEIESAMQQFYENLGLKCRFVKRNAKSIKHAATSMKISILIYSPYGEKYVEVGCLNLASDFVSKRLLTLFEEDKELINLYILNGTFMDVTKMVGLVIENCQTDTFSLDEVKLKENISAFIRKLSS